MPAQQKHELLEQAAAVSGTALEGLDLRWEIESVEVQGLGDTLLLFEDDLVGFAVCHVGPGSEAGSGACYVKFGVVRTGSAAESRVRAPARRLVRLCSHPRRRRPRRRLQRRPFGPLYRALGEAQELTTEELAGTAAGMPRLTVRR